MINQNLKEIQSKLSDLKENKARNEATIEGIDNRKKDLLYSVKNELKLKMKHHYYSQSDLNILARKICLVLKNNHKKLKKLKNKETLGSVNLKS